MIGTTIETAIRIMSRWGKDDIVRTEKDGFLVVDARRSRRVRAHTDPSTDRACLISRTLTAERHDQSTRRAPLIAAAAAQPAPSAEKSQPRVAGRAEHVRRAAHDSVDDADQVGRVAEHRSEQDAARRSGR